MIFSVVKLDLFIRALLLDRILAMEKTMRTPRVHLVRRYFCYGKKVPYVVTREVCPSTVETTLECG